MNPLSNGKMLSEATQGLTADARSLDALKREAGRDPAAAVKKAAQQFEALFMQMVLKSMRDATPKSGMFDSSANEMATGMLDQQLATKVAASGTGLADMIARQLTRHMKQSAVGSPESAEAGRPSGVGSRESAEASPLSAVGSRQSAADLHPDSREPAGRPAGVSQIGKPVPSETADRRLPTADSKQRDFATKMWDHALAAERATGVPAKFIVGQAALESGWGAREIRGAAGIPSHNLFGIKAGSQWQGRTVEVLTTEYENGVARKVVEKFRAYNNYSEAFRDWAQLMANNPRYAGVLAQARGAQDARGFAQGMQRAGYATDPDYGAKLARVINTASALRGAA